MSPTEAFCLTGTFLDRYLGARSGVPFQEAAITQISDLIESGIEGSTCVIFPFCLRLKNCAFSNVPSQHFERNGGQVFPTENRI